MDSVSLKIRDVIQSVIENEDSELRKLNLNKGIFFLPELGLTYLIGKELVKNAVDVFGCEIKSWDPEWGMGSGKPFDLVITLENRKIYLFEFKTRQKSASYINDIRKLKNIDQDNVEKYFCAFIDCPNKNLPEPIRVKDVERDCGEFIVRITNEKYFESFETIDHYKLKPINCVFAMWKVKRQ